MGSCLLMGGNDLFWDATIDELKRGYKYVKEHESFECIICGEAFREGVIYPNNGTLYEAKLAIKNHIQEQHKSMFHYLLSMNKKYTGLSELQTKILTYFKEGRSDKEIASELEVGSTSTIRTHRFKFKEKEKQAKVFLAIMDLLNDKEDKKNEFVPFHKGATMVDERYAITQKEKEKVLTTYFKEGLEGTLHSFPSKEKRKIIILQHILSRFTSEKVYSEPEVNEVLKSIYSDFVTIRRYLIEYGFMERSKDCREYWVKK
jgi:hypothetical protein